MLIDLSNVFHFVQILIFSCNIHYFLKDFSWFLQLNLFSISSKFAAKFGGKELSKQCQGSIDANRECVKEKNPSDATKSDKALGNIILGWLSRSFEYVASSAELSLPKFYLMCSD